MVTKHLLQELGYEVTLVNHVDSHSAKAWPPKRGLGRMKHVMAEVHVRARRRGEEADDTCLCKHELEQNRHDDKVSFEAHMKGCAMLGLKLSREDGKLAQ